MYFDHSHAHNLSLHLHPNPPDPFTLPRQSHFNCHCSSFFLFLLLVIADCFWCLPDLIRAACRSKGRGECEVLFTWALTSYQCLEYWRKCLSFTRQTLTSIVPPGRDGILGPSLLIDRMFTNPVVLVLCWWSRLLKALPTHTLSALSSGILSEACKER